MKIHHDIHTHTFTSSCCDAVDATPENYIRKAAELGHTTFGFSNHLWDESVDGASSFYRPQSFAHILPEKDQIRALDNCGMKILFGAEVEYRGMCDILALRAANASVLDYVLIPHTHTHMRGFIIPEFHELVEFRNEYADRIRAESPWMSDDTVKRMANSLQLKDMFPALQCSQERYEKFVADFMIQSYEQLLANPEFEKLIRTLPVIIAHPFGPCGESNESFMRICNMVDRDRLRKCFITTAKLGVAFDINICMFLFLDTIETDPMVDIMRLAKECGVKFTFGTDAHSIQMLSNIRSGDIISDAIGMTEDDLFDLVK